MRTLLSFFSYHNAVPLAAVVLVLGASTAFAATVLPSQEAGVDASYLLELDLGAFSPEARITHVAETEEEYVIAYELSTVAVVRGAWGEVRQEKTMTVDKRLPALRGGLEAYVLGQLREVVEAERARVARAQAVALAAHARGVGPAPSALSALVGLTSGETLSAARSMFFVAASEPEPAELSAPELPPEPREEEKAQEAPEAKKEEPASAPAEEKTEEPQPEAQELQNPEASAQNGQETPEQETPQEEDEESEETQTPNDPGGI